MHHATDLTAQPRRPGPEPLDRRVVGLAAAGAGGIALAGVHSLSGGRIGLPCPLHAITGLDCPFCGSTRMAAALLHGDVAAAWRFNAPMLAVGIIAGLLVGYLLLAWTLEWLRLVRLPRPRLSPWLQLWLPRVFLAGMATFGVLRNLL